MIHKPDPRSDPKLVERIARAMCRANGVDADSKCAYDDSTSDPMWILYALLADTAIQELEAAAMEPLPVSSDSVSLPPLPVERTPPPSRFHEDDVAGEIVAAYRANVFLASQREIIEKMMPLLLKLSASTARRMDSE